MVAIASMRVTCDTLTVRHSMGHCLIMVDSTKVPGGIFALAQEADPESTAARALDAAQACMARFGVAKTTIDDIAREANLSRATMYRHYANKHEMFGAVAQREILRIAEAVNASIASDGTLIDAVTNAIVTTARRLNENPALAFVLVHEPEALVPFLAFDAAAIALRHAAAFGAVAFEPWLDPVAAERAGELIARIVLAYLSPQEISILTDPETVRDLASTFLVPGLMQLHNVTR